MDEKIIGEAQYALRQYAETFWFRGEASENEAQQKRLHAEYHHLHDIIKGLDAFRS